MWNEPNLLVLSFLLSVSLGLPLHIKHDEHLYWAAIISTKSQHRISNSTLFWQRLFEFIKLTLMLTNDITSNGYRNCSLNRVCDVCIWWRVRQMGSTKEMYWFRFAFKSPAINLANLWEGENFTEMRWEKIWTILNQNHFSMGSSARIHEERHHILSDRTFYVMVLNKRKSEQ